MESIAELRTICQMTAKKDVSNVYMRYVCRFLSIYVTRLFLPLGINADQASFLMIVTGVVANIFLSGSEAASWLIGALLLQLWYILDCVDGEIARYHFFKQKNEIVKEKERLLMTGAYWDFLNHYIVHGLAPLALSYGLFQAGGEAFWLPVGFVASIAQVMLIAVHDTKYRAYVVKIRTASKRGLATFAYGEPFGERTKPVQIFNPVKELFKAVHHSCTYPTMMNVITLAAFAQFFFGPSLPADLRKPLLAYYAAGSILVFLMQAAKNLRNHGVDRDFDAEFRFQKQAAE